MKITLRSRYSRSAVFPRPSGLLALFVAAAAAFLAGVLLPPTAARAADPTLTPLSQEGLTRTYRAGSRYTLRLRFTDADGDRPIKNKSLFIDEAQSGRIEIPATRISGDPSSGATIEWDVNGFEQGAHRTRFEVTGSDGKLARYPPDTGEFYEFVSESLGLKLGIMAGGMLVGLLFVPFLIYVLARSMNRRGDPSKAARIGLLFGILACAGLFIYLFASFYGPLVVGIGLVGALALIVLVLTRR